MRTYYASDKKRREEAKRKQKEQKRLKKLNKNASTDGSSEAEKPASDAGEVTAEGTAQVDTDR